MPRRIAHRLQVEYFGCFIARRHAASRRAGAHYRREISHAPVQFRQQQDGDKVERRRDDQQRLSLELSRGQWNLLHQGLQLRQVGLSVVELHRDGDNLIDRLPGESLNLGKLFRGNGVGEVEEDHKQ